MPTVIKLDSLLNALDTVNALSLINKNHLDINAPFPWNYGTLLFHFTNDYPTRAEFPQQVIKPELVKFLLNNGANPNASGGIFQYEMLTEIEHKIVVSCDSVIARILTRAGSKYQPDFDLARASEKQDKKGILRALKNGASPSEAFPYAYRSDRDFFEELLSSPKVNKDKALYLACGQHPGYSTFTYGTCYDYDFRVNPDTSLIRRLVKLGAAPDIAIGYCAYNKLYALTRFLIAHGASKDKALSAAIAAQNPDLDFIKEIIDKGAKIERVDGGTPNIQDLLKNPKLKKLILNTINGSAYSEIGEFNEDGFYSSSLLLSACGDNEFYIVEFMLQTGADPNVYTVPSESHKELSNCNFISALGLAMYNNNRDLVALLRKYKAKLPPGCKPPVNWEE